MPLVIGHALAVRAWWVALSRTCSASVAWSDADVVDPLTRMEIARGSLSNDLVDVAAALAYGLRHYDAGRVTEALWWWQFSYLSTWGDRAASALR